MRRASLRRDEVLLRELRTRTQAAQPHPGVDTTPSKQDLLKLKRDIDRLRRESERAMAAVGEVYGDTVPDMLVIPRRVG